MYVQLGIVAGYYYLCMFILTSLFLIGGGGSVHFFLQSCQYYLSSGLLVRQEITVLSCCHQSLSYRITEFQRMEKTIEIVQFKLLLLDRIRKLRLRKVERPVERLILMVEPSLLLGSPDFYLVHCPYHKYHCVQTNLRLDLETEILILSFKV